MLFVCLSLSFPPEKLQVWLTPFTQTSYSDLLSMLITGPIFCLSKISVRSIVKTKNRKCILPKIIITFRFFVYTKCRTHFLYRQKVVPIIWCIQEIGPTNCLYKISYRFFVNNFRFFVWTIGRTDRLYTNGVRTTPRSPMIRNGLAWLTPYLPA